MNSSPHFLRDSGLRTLRCICCLRWHLTVSCSVSLCRLRSTGILDFSGSCALQVRDRLDWLSGFGWHASRQHRALLQTFVSVPVDSKHYASYSFAFVNHQAEQFRRCWCQLQAGKKDVYLFSESSIRKWRHCAFLHSVEVLERTFVYVAVDSKHCLSYGFADTSALSPFVLIIMCSLLK